VDRRDNRRRKLVNQTLKNLRKLNILRKEKAALLNAILNSAYLSLVGEATRFPDHPLRVKFTCGLQSFVAVCPPAPVTKYKWLGRAEHGLFRQTPALVLIAEEEQK